MSNSPNVYCLERRNTGTNTLEVHILSGADNFQTFSLHTGTALSVAAAANCDFAVAEGPLHVLNGADNFQPFLLHAGTALSLAAAAANFLFEVPLVSKHPVLSPTQWCCQVLKYEQVGADLTVCQKVLLEDMERIRY
jgi:hypothetical protein